MKKSIFIIFIFIFVSIKANGNECEEVISSNKNDDGFIHTVKNEINAKCEGQGELSESKIKLIQIDNLLTFNISLQRVVCVDNTARIKFQLDGSNPIVLNAENKDANCEGYILTSIDHLENEFEVANLQFFDVKEIEILIDGEKFNIELESKQRELFKTQINCLKKIYNS